MKLGPEDIRRLVPHGGSMCLLEGVEAWSPLAIVCVTERHRSAANPLRHDGKLSSVVAIEFAAQAAAVHGALSAPSDAGVAPRLLVGIRNCRFHCTTLDDVEGSLRIEARLFARTAELAVYDFSVEQRARRLVEGRISIYTERPSGP